MLEQLERESVYKLHGNWSRFWNFKQSVPGNHCVDAQQHGSDADTEESQENNGKLDVTHVF